ncbi:transglycosylase SLT domain-containing protein [Trinickia sp. YCB016]
MPTSTTIFKRRAAAAFFAALCAPLCVAAPAARAADNCWTQAGSEYGIDPLLLYSIAKVESSLNPKAFNRNSDGSFDVGIMQINSTHLPRLRKVGVTRERLVREPCTAIRSGAEILAGFIDQVGYTWEAVGAYNAGLAPEREGLRQVYAAKVWKEYEALTLKRATRYRQRESAGD